MLVGGRLPVDVHTVITVVGNKIGHRRGEGRPVGGLTEGRKGPVLPGATEGNDAAHTVGMGRVDEHASLGPLVGERIIGIRLVKGVGRHGQIVPRDIRGPIDASTVGILGLKTVAHNLVRRSSLKSSGSENETNKNQNISKNSIRQ